MSKERKNVDKGISFSFWTIGKHGSYCFFFNSDIHLLERESEKRNEGGKKGKGRKIAD